MIIKHSNFSKNNDFSEYERDIERFLSLAQSENNEILLFVFDPNTAQKEDFKKLGLPSNVINNIINYRDKGGKFYNAEGFARIYGMRNEDFTRLKDYIKIENQHNSKRKGYDRKNENRIDYELFYFDPNTISFEDLKKLGLTERQSSNIIKYRENGGLFYSPEDIQKIYSINKTKAEELKPYIQISRNIQFRDEYIDKNYSVIIELNSADIISLQRVKGIGPFYSEKIIEYRDKLGGFYILNQLLEINVISDSVFQNISSQLEINIELIKKININTADYKELIVHPYIDRQTCNLILEYKRFKGEIKSLDELKSQKVISTDIFEKLKWYLDIK